MKKTILFCVLFIGIVYAFSPEPTDPELVVKCESTGGTITESYDDPDCGPGCDAMPETITDCECPDGIIYMDIKRIGNFGGCDGSQPICFRDGDCQRTNQGTDCSGGTCMYVQQPDNICLFSIVLVFLGVMSVISMARNRTEYI